MYFLQFYEDIFTCLGQMLYLSIISENIWFTWQASSSQSLPAAHNMFSLTSSLL